jgi:hypothetical protein
LCRGHRIVGLGCRDVKGRAFGEPLIDIEEDPLLRTVVIGFLRWTDSVLRASVGRAGPWPFTLMPRWLVRTFALVGAD